MIDSDTGDVPNEPAGEGDRDRFDHYDGAPEVVLADLFEGFASTRIDTRGAKIFARVGGSGPPVLLIHGFPQTHVMWHRTAPSLAERFTVVLPDLRGYGWSSVPRSDPGHRVYSKRTMAEDMVDVMEALGHIRFAVVGHDRGARVGYRLALDQPGRVERLALLDIVPTYEMWQRLTPASAMRIYHWLFLAQPSPLPETLIARAPRDYLEHTLASWTQDKDLSAFDERALEHYRAFFEVPDRIHACCEDYRAGQSVDYEHDRENRERGDKIGCPTLALWGEAGIPAETHEGPLDIWRAWCRTLEGKGVRSGHFLAEENPDATLASLLPFLAG